MKARFLAVLGLVAAIQSQSTTRHPVQIEVQHSEAASYWHFLQAGFEQPFTSRSLSARIKKVEPSLFTKKAHRALFDKLMSFLTEGYNLPPAVSSRPIGFFAEDALLSLAASSRSLRDFEKGLSAILPYAGIEAYFELKKVMEAPFRKILWDSSVGEHTAEIEKLREAMAKSDFGKWLENARKFYKSAFPENLPFQIALIPLDPTGLKERHTSATNLRDIQIVPYFRFEKGAVDNLDVIFHEFCHALYEAQPSSVQVMIDDFFLGHRSPHALFLYRYFNEAIATALGNGFYAQKLRGNLSKESWYSDPQINSLAHALLPLVAEYIETAKAMDKGFLQRSLQIAEKAFPDGHRLMASNFLSINLLVDPNSTSVLIPRKVLRQEFRIQSFELSAPPKAEDWTQLNRKGLRNVVFVSSDKNSGLSEVSKSFPSLEILSKIEKADEFILTIPISGRYFIWMNSHSEASLLSLVRKLKAQEKLDDELGLITL